jgi:hypothetical protein
MRHDFLRWETAVSQPFPEKSFRDAALVNHPLTAGLEMYGCNKKARNIAVPGHLSREFFDHGLAGAAGASGVSSG